MIEAGAKSTFMRIVTMYQIASRIKRKILIHETSTVIREMICVTIEMVVNILKIPTLSLVYSEHIRCAADVMVKTIVARMNKTEEIFKDASHRICRNVILSKFRTRHLKYAQFVV